MEKPDDITNEQSCVTFLVVILSPWALIVNWSDTPNGIIEIFLNLGREPMVSGISQPWFT